jgi:DNA-binding LacI/PurR family transcriptional regulator
MPSPLTIRSLAQQLGLSKSTVQRALAGPSGISPEVRERVQEAARRLGYRPDPLFAILGSQWRKHRRHSAMLAYVIGSPEVRRGMAHLGAGVNTFADVKCRAEELGYEVEQISIDELGAGKRMMDVLYNRGIVGVIIGSNIRSSAHQAILANEHLPVVCCGRIDALPLHTVQPDVIQTMRLAWSRTLAAGYRRIGGAIGIHVPAVVDDSDRLSILLGLQEETLEKQNRVPPCRSLIGDEDSIVAWFHKYKPDAVIGFHSGTYFTLRDAGIDMRRVGYCSLHTLPAASGGIVVSGVMENNQAVARESVNLLESLIRHRSMGIPDEPIRYLLPGCWIEGKTL